MCGPHPEELESERDSGNHRCSMARGAIATRLPAGANDKAPTCAYGF